MIRIYFKRAIWFLLTVGIIYAVIYEFKNSKEEYKIPKTEITALYMHSVNRYSVAVKHGEIINIKRMQDDAPVKIITDATDIMWYTCDYTYDTWSGSRTGSCSVHVFSTDDINGAGWDRGKFGSGTTTRIH